MNPYPIQVITWLLSIVAIGLMLDLVRRGWLAWRWTIMPGLIALLYVMFYSWLLFWRPFGEYAWLSAIIRVMEALMFVTFLVMWYWRKRGRL